MSQAGKGQLVTVMLNDLAHEALEEAVFDTGDSLTDVINRALIVYRETVRPVPPGKDSVLIFSGMKNVIVVKNR